jgi:oligoribonuclease
MIAFLDLETTGLDPRRDMILEAGIVITNDGLDVIAERTVVVGLPVSSPMVNERLDAFNGFTRKMHTASGLLAEVAASQHTNDSAELQLVDFLAPMAMMEKPVMGGSSVHFDRRFIEQWMPNLLELFSYRNADVSAVREFARRWRPELTEHEPQAAQRHRVLADIFDSIALAKFYRQNLFTHP